MQAKIENGIKGLRLFLESKRRTYALLEKVEEGDVFQVTSRKPQKGPVKSLTLIRVPQRHNAESS